MQSLDIRGQNTWMNSLSLLRKREGRARPWRSEYFRSAKVSQRSKVNLSFLALFSVVLVVDADEFLE